MAGELESVTREMFGALDRGDADAMIALGASEMQSVDEISRRWLRGLDEVAGYVRQLMGVVQDVHSTISNVNETVWGDTGTVTCWLDQGYSMEGVHQHISAPTTLVFRKEGNDWKVALFHSVPLAAENA
jgi:ketosteroid isomerase-like protein